MLFLLIIFLICAASLTVLFWVTTLFFQGYYYTEPTKDIHWQAPAAAGVLAAFFTVWSFLVLNSPEATNLDVPYDTIFRFSPQVDMQKEPFREIWVHRKGSKEPVAYKRFGEPGPAGRTRYIYKETNVGGRKYTATGVEAIEVPVDKGKLRFNVGPPSAGSNYREFVAVSGGWTMTEYEEGPDGTPRAFRWGRFLATILLNVAHLALWFVCFWLLLRYQLGHALGFAVVSWLVITLAILPMVLTEAGTRAAGG